MLSFKKHIKEAEAKAYGLDPKAGDEKRFKDKHVVAVTDYPGNDDDKDVQNMTKKSPAKKKRLADMDQAEAEKVYEEKMMKCEDCGEEYDADEGEHECEMDEEVNQIIAHLIEEGIDIDELTEEQLDEIIGRIVRGAASLAKKAVVNKHGNFRLGSAGRADAQAAKIDKEARRREKNKEAHDRVVAAKERLKNAAKDEAQSKKRAGLNNSYVPEEKMTDSDVKKREEIVKGMKKSEDDLKKRYGDRWKAVMYATATKKAMEEEKKNKTILVVNPKSDAAKKGGGVFRIPADQWPEYKKKGYSLAEDTQLDEISVELAKKVFKARADRVAQDVDDNNRARARMNKHDAAHNSERNPEKNRKHFKNWEKARKDKEKAFDNLRKSDRKLHKSGALLGKKTGAGSDSDKVMKRYNATPAGKWDAYREKGGKLSRKAWDAQYGNRGEEFQIDEAFKIGAMKLKDGSSVKLAKEDVQALDNLYKNLNSSNRKKMQEKLEADKKSFGEILAFAKQAM